MRQWERGATLVLAGLLCLNALGHASGFVPASRALVAGGIETTLAEALRTLWLTISAMFAFFGFSLFRQALRVQAADRVSMVGIGVVLVSAGVVGLVVSHGKPFWAQHVVLGGAIAALGLRLPRGAEPLQS
jgi:hypothetical protein